MRAVSPKRAALNRKRRKAETALGRDSDGNGSCWRCGRWGEVHGHEREGGSKRNHLVPDALLCNPCNEWCEADPPEAAATGWKVTSKYEPYSYLQPWQAVNLAGEIVDFPS